MNGTRPLDNTKIRLSSRSLKAVTDEMLFLGLTRRGYEVSKFSEDTETEVPAEIVKITF